MKTLIKNGIIIDGTGAEPFKADISIVNDTITSIGEADNYTFDRVFDAGGLMVTPGLIDAHTHSELNIMYNRQHPNALYQGISTIVVGQCGLGFAPIGAGCLEESIKYNSGIFANYYKYLKPWEKFEEYLDLLGGCGVNVASNVSHNAIRQISCDYLDIPLTGERLNKSLRALRESMEQGALGLSIGLSYYPGGYSNTEELIKMCEVVKEYNGILCVHLRLDDGQISMSPVQEIAEVVKRTGVRLNMLHYRTSGMENYSSVFEPFKELEEAGADIHYEFYPYLVGAGLLMALVPGWVQEGGFDTVMDRLTDQSLRPRIIKEIEERRKYFFAENQTATMILTKDPYASYIGKTLDQIGAERGLGYAETVIEMLVDNELQAGFAGVDVNTEEMSEKLYSDQYKLFMDERYTVGSDTIPGGTMLHPRAFGGMARTIRHMRERGASPEFIIKKLTSYPAAIYHLEGRGVLKTGNKADIAIMDIEKVSDRATFSDTRRAASGVDTLFVNGMPALLHGEITGLLFGDAVKRGKG